MILEITMRFCFAAIISPARVKNLKMCYYKQKEVSICCTCEEASCFTTYLSVRDQSWTIKEEGVSK